MKKIIITGGAGYIGSHLVKQLIESSNDFDIHVIDNFSQSRKNILVQKNLTYHEIDIRNKVELSNLFEKIKPSLVMHFAALASVPDSVENPAAYFETNVIGTFNLLEAMRENECLKIIFSSSASVYGEPQTEIITEDHQKNPTNPYGYTKLVGEKMLESYYQAYGISSVSFRYFCAAGNEPTYVVGEYHTPETHAIPSIVETALGERPFFYIYGEDYDTPDGTGIRDYIHVDDLASAHIKAIDLLDKGPIYTQYNLGINKGFSVRELISAVETVHGKSIETTVKSRRPGDPSRLIANASRAMKDLDWQPKYLNIEEIVKTAYEAFKKRL